jgi:muramoyltetrapeptide carboxypeptidase
MTLLKPPPLQPGATVGIISPSGSPDPDRLDAGIRYLERQGYRVIVGEHAGDARGYLAGLDHHRASDIHRMFADPEVGAIFCSRGGYGSGRLLDALDYDLIRSNPKPLVGLSDTTALQLSLLTRTDLVTFTGFALTWDLRNGVPDLFTERALWSVLTSTDPLSLALLEEVDLRVLHGGRAVGPLIGGCLTLLCTLIGTPYLPDLRGAILLLEDIDEAPYRIDRMLNQLRLTGVLGSVAGIVFGEFKDCFTPEEMERSLSLEEMVADLTAGLTIPIISNFPYGHGDRRLVLPVGVPVELDADRGVFRLLESGVASL